MKRILLLFLFFARLCFAQSWQQLPNFPAAGRDDGSAFVIGNSVYCGLGNAQGVGPSTDFYRFELGTDSWSSYTVAALPVLGRQYCSAFTWQGYGYIVGGVDANWLATNEVWRYDTLSNSWAQKAPVPDSLFGALCFFINNKAYVCGGRDQNNQQKKTVWEYDVVNDSWQQKGDMPDGGRWRASGGVINNKGYLVFGATSQTTFSNKVFEYNAGSDSWLQIDSFPGIGRTYAASGIVNGFLVVALGIDSSGSVYNDCYLYDVTAHQWISQNPLPSFGRKGCLAFSYNNSFYISAGIDGQSNRLTETWKADNLNSLQQYQQNRKIIAYPNPAKDILHVAVENGSYVELMNPAGQPVFFSGRANSQMQIDTQQFPDGVYFLKISGSHYFSNQKIIVQH